MGEFWDRGGYVMDVIINVSLLKREFKDKVVMDVGTGSGILAVWAAQAGAKRVYAIEYTDMAKHARNVVRANGVDHIVTVIQGAVEEVILPEEDWDGVGLTLENNGQQQSSEKSDS